MKAVPPELKDWSELVLKVLSSLAIVAAGGWAYLNWNLSETTATNIEIRLTADVTPYSKGCSLVALHVRPKNIGKVLVTPGKAGLRVTLSEIPSGLPPSYLNRKALIPFAEVKDVTQRYKGGLRT